MKEAIIAEPPLSPHWLQPEIKLENDSITLTIAHHGFCFSFQSANDKKKQRSARLMYKSGCMTMR